MEEKGGHPMEILDRSRIGPPPPNSTPTSVIPLSFFDIPWIFCHPMQRLIFYDVPYYSVVQFTETALPSLKRSLSLALQEFFPLAGALAFPSPPGKPQIVYSDGDSVSFTAVVSDGDLDELASDLPQATSLVHPLLPPLPPPSVKDGISVAALLAVQVTLFPNRGICIGTQFLHVAADGMAFNHFMKTWASICTADLQGARIEKPPCPVLDRSVVKDPDGLEPILLKECLPSAIPSPSTRPNNDSVRATFTLSKAAIDRLKSQVVNSSTTTSEEPLHISTFAVVCAYTWVCLIKSKEIDDNNHGSMGREISGNDNLYHFLFAADCRSRLGYPIPKTYFGNCLVPGLVALKGDVLVGRHGVASAARAIGAKVKELNVGGGGAMKGARTWMSEIRNATNMVSVAGSPRLRVYETNFGWGRPRKALLVHIDSSKSISLLDSRDEECGVEVGLALDKVSMATFSTLFRDRLDSI